MASGSPARNTAATSDTDTAPLNTVMPIAIDSGTPSSTIPIVRLRASVALAAGTCSSGSSVARSAASSSGSSGRSLSPRRSSHDVSV